MTRRLCAVTVCVALCAGAAQAQAPRLDGVRVNLWPSPRVVPADGKTASTVRAEFRDAGGRPIADGGTVVFRIEGGELSLGGDERRQVVTTTTEGGAATVYATSTAPGAARVYAELTTGEGRNRTTVTFVEEGSSLLGGVGVVQVRGGWVGYALDLALVEARDEAEVEFGGVRIVAQDVLQVDVNALTVTAVNARVEVNERSLQAQAVTYDLMTGEGALQRLGDVGVERFCFDCYSLEEREPEDELRGEQFRLNSAEAGAWAVADGVSIYPQEKIVLRSGALYTGGEKVLDLPTYWLIAMPGYTGTTHSQVLGVNSEGGLAVDFPYFYRVTETTTGAVKLQKGASSGSVIARDDWSLAVEEAYDTGTTEGSVSVTGLPRSDWGMEWRDQRDLGGRRDAHITAYTPDHESYYANANVYEWQGDRRLNLSASLQRPRGSNLSYGLSADWLTFNQPVRSLNASYRLGTAVGLRHVAGMDDGVVGEYQGYGSLDFRRERLSERTSLTPRLSNLFTWDTGGYQQNSLRGELELRQIVSSDKSVRLSYQAQLTSGDNAEGYEHLVNLNLRAYHGRRFRSYLSSTYDLSDEELYAFGVVDYDIDERWRLGLAGTYYQVDTGAYDDIEITVARDLGGTELGLRWSEASGRISVEVGEFTGLGLY